MGLSRDTFYRNGDTVEEDGVEALLEKNRRVPNPRNRVDLETETAVVDYAVECPAHGQVRVSNRRHSLADVRYCADFVCSTPNSVAKLRLDRSLTL